VDAEKDMPRKHLISMNIANGRAKVANPNPHVSIFNFHYCFPPDVVGTNYGLDKVIGDNETGFRGKADVTYRTEGWDFILAGGGLYNNLDYSFTAKHPDGTFLEYESPGGGSPELRKQLGILKTFIHGFDFILMVPDTTFITGGVPEGGTARALVEPGRQYAIYIKGGTHADLKLNLPAGSYRAEWLDTKTGKTVWSGKLRHPGGEAVLRSPDYSEDIALSIRAAR